MTSSLHHNWNKAALTQDRRIRDAVKEFAPKLSYTHWVTLTTNAIYSEPRMRALLKCWRIELLRRLHGRRFFELPETEVTHFFGALESPPSGLGHFHLIVAVPPASIDMFEFHAPACWGRRVRSGSCWIERAKPDPDYVRLRLSYAVKHITNATQCDFVDSRLMR